MNQLLLNGSKGSGKLKHDPLLKKVLGNLHKQSKPASKGQFIRGADFRAVMGRHGFTKRESVKFAYYLKDLGLAQPSRKGVWLL